MAATLKQKKAFKEVVNGSSLTKAMKIAGYSDESAKRTNKLTATKGWEQLMKTYLPDKLLAQKHLELLNKRVYDLQGNDIGPETQAVYRGLDMAYKMKQRYPKEGGNQTAIQVNIGQHRNNYGQ